jgi:hypothetical protein
VAFGRKVMKRSTVLSGALLVLGSAYAAWMEWQRRQRARERSTDIERWESEGGNPRGDRSANDPSKADPTQEL